jgi:hypothetical protein
MASLAEETRLYQAVQHEHARAHDRCDVEEQDRIALELERAKASLFAAWIRDRGES